MNVPVEVVTGPWIWPVGALKISSSSGCWKLPGTTSVRRPPLSLEVGSVENCAATFFQLAGDESAWRGLQRLVHLVRVLVLDDPDRPLRGHRELLLVGVVVVPGVAV